MRRRSPPAPIPRARQPQRPSLQGQADTTRRDRRILGRQEGASAVAVRDPALSDRRLFPGSAWRPVDLVSQRDIAARLVVLEREKGAATARRARVSCQPCTCGRCARASSRSIRPSARPRQPSLPAVRACCQTTSLSGSGAPAVTTTRPHHRLLILTGARRSEIGGIAWAEIDDERGTWILPAERSKIIGHTRCR